jgi:hypothetical protein
VLFLLLKIENKLKRQEEVKKKLKKNESIHRQNKKNQRGVGNALFK